MKIEKLKNYICYMTELMKTQANQVKKNINNSKEDWDGYKEGQLLAYYTIISTLKNQALFFNLEQEDVGLEDINPDVDLLAVHERTETDFKDENL